MQPLFLLIIPAAVILFAAIAILCVWGCEILSLLSLTRLRAGNEQTRENAVFSIHIRGGFHLDDFVRQGGVKSDQALIDFVIARLTKGLIPLSLTAPKIGCSSFTAFTQDGDALFARNYDFARTNTLLVRTDAVRGRHATISSVDLSFLGLGSVQEIKEPLKKALCLAAPYVPLDGMNDAGVACGIYMTYQGGGKSFPTDQNTGRPGCTSTTLLRLILDYASNVDEAVEIARSYDLHDSGCSSYQYMVADASGRSAILEWIHGDNLTDTDGTKRELIVYYNDADEAVGPREAESRFQWVTNFIVAPGYYDASPASLKYGQKRYDRIYETLSESNGVVRDEQAAMKLLSDISKKKDKGFTVHSAVYNLTNRTVLWIANQNYEDETAFFRLGPIK